MTPRRARRDGGGPPPSIISFPRDGSPLQVCAAVPSARDRIGRMHPPSYGVGTTQRAAAARARWELQERRAGVWRGDEDAVHASWAEVASQAVPPNAVLLFSARQVGDRGPVPLLGLDHARRLAWVEGHRLAGPGTRLVPAHLVYYGAPGRPGRADSNGCAAGRSVADATLRALLELVERDAVALWWYHRLRRPAVPIRALTAPLVQRVLAWLDARGRETWALDLTTDLGIPTVVAISVHRGATRPRPLLGFGTALDRGDAVRRALQEVAQSDAIVRATDEGRWAQLRADRRWLRHATLVAHPHLVPAVSGHPARHVRRMAGAASRRTTDALAFVVRRLVRAGLDPLVVDQTRPGDPCRVVRALVPGLRPWWPRFAPGRLFDAPVAAGWCERTGDESSLNPFGIWF